MRILAVRGQNLASLAERFEIDLTREPLAGAGLFAITGETGAGKSTLLDAICLALYGEFPRVSAKGADEDVPDPAGEALKARDARSILRRGASTGWSEVDFVGVDGATYRTHWAVNRARGKATGRLQAPTRQIDRLGPDGTPIETVAEKPRAVDARIVELTDLTFEQFRRTVLLAQGDFDAFLRADDRDRADLLEKITGTDIYARLSARAFDRTREERDKVAQLEARRQEIGLLEPDARADRLAHRAALGERIAEVRRGAEAARLDLARHDRIAAAEALAAAALAEIAAADAAQLAATESRARLAALAAAAAVRPAFTRLGEARTAEARAVSALAEIEAQLAEATPRFERACEARDVARGARDAVEARIQALAPQWEAATQLDTKIDEATAEAQAATAPEQAAIAARDVERGRLATIDRRRAEIAGDLARLGHDLTHMAAIAPLAERWDEVASRLDDRIATAAEVGQARSRRMSAEATIAALQPRLDAHDRDEAADADRRRAIEAQIATRRAALTALDEPAARTRDGAFAALLGDIARLTPVAAARAAALDDLAAALTAGDGARGDVVAAESRRATVEAQAQSARTRREASRAAGDLADAMASAEAIHLRGHLADGAPCPVCGGLDHPIVADPGIAAALARVRGEREALAAEIADLDRLLSGLDGAIAAAKARLDEIGRRQSAAEARRTAAEATLLDGLDALVRRTGALGLGFDLALAGSDPRAALATLAAAAEQARRAVSESLDRAVVLRGEIDLEREALDRLDVAREIRRAARAIDDKDLSTARAEATAAAETESGATRRRGELDARLAPLLEGLDIGLDDLDRDAPALTARLARAVGERREKIEQLDRLGAEEKDLERTRAGLFEAVERAEQAVAATSATLAARRETLERLAGERSRVLGGVATALHREAAARDRIEAQAALDAATQALDAARSAHESAMTIQGERHAALADRQTDVQARAAERDRALAAAELTIETAAGLLSVSAAEVERLREEIAALDDRSSRAAAAAAERRADLAAALEAGRPEVARTDLEARIATARDQAETLNREIGALDQVLADDDRAQAAATGLEAEIVAARATLGVWAAVDEAIGSRDGAKFRQFAQGITLDRLTGLANRHLASLNPRYRLGRADGLGLTIIDRDMGDEVRSTRSLSGGERFLASLALALALSGLEGRRSFVDTLFIDEGFGSLDAATLDVAIDALEGLQSEGRKVGVISHVAAMHERIPVQIKVEKAGAGRSRVSISAGRD